MLVVCRQKRQNFNELCDMYRTIYCSKRSKAIEPLKQIIAVLHYLYSSLSIWYCFRLKIFPGPNVVQKVVTQIPCFVIFFSINCIHKVTLRIAVSWQLQSFWSSAFHVFKINRNFARSFFCQAGWNLHQIKVENCRLSCWAMPFCVNLIYLYVFQTSFSCR